jgi:hypothetical protein
MRRKKMIAKTLKELLKAHNLNTITGYENIEYFFKKDAHGQHWNQEGERCVRFDFRVHGGKVLVREATIGTYQAISVPWKGEDPTEMCFQYEYVG